MNGLIIIDGPDATGKTTLAKYICETYQGEYIHLGYEAPGDMEAYQTTALTVAVERSKDKLVVIDRFWTSEQIYGRVKRDGSELPYNARNMDRVIRKQAGLYIIAADEPRRVADRFEQLKTERPELYAEAGIFDIATAYYFFLLGRSALDKHTRRAVEGITPDDYTQAYSLTPFGFAERPDVLQYRVGEDDLEAFARLSVLLMRQWQVRQYQPALDPDDRNVLGHQATAKILFVGNATEQDSWPFYANAPCVRLLNQALHSIGFDETKAMWTNINGPGGPEHAYALVAAGLFPIALGHKAEKALVKLLTGSKVARTYGYVQHPEHYVKTGYAQKDLVRPFADSLKAVLRNHAILSHSDF